jgi:hypothetical protein
MGRNCPAGEQWLAWVAVELATAGQEGGLRRARRLFRIAVTDRGRPEALTAGASLLLSFLEHGLVAVRHLVRVLVSETLRNHFEVEQHVVG